MNDPMQDTGTLDDLTARAVFAAAATRASLLGRGGYRAIWDAALAYAGHRATQAAPLTDATEHREDWDMNRPTYSPTRHGLHGPDVRCGRWPCDFVDLIEQRDGERAHVARLLAAAAEHEADWDRREAALRAQCERLREALVQQHQAFAPNKVLPHVLCAICALIAGEETHGT